jgi:hypothetical protein
MLCPYDHEMSIDMIYQDKLGTIKRQGKDQCLFPKVVAPIQPRRRLREGEGEVRAALPS